MSRVLRKLDPGADDPGEDDANLAYYLTLTPAVRVRMCVERSILLLKLANRNAEDRTSPRLAKRI
jgi:hypothetical protein